MNISDSFTDKDFFKSLFILGIYFVLFFEIYKVKVYEMIQSKFCKVCLLAPSCAALSQPAELEGEALRLE